MGSKRSKAELTRLVEAAVTEVCHLPRPGLWFCVNELEVTGTPPDHFRVWATLHFSTDGSPFCCCEPQCHLGLLGERLAAVSQHLQRAMNLRHAITIEFCAIQAQLGAGVEVRVAPIVEK